ncbi:MAG: alginate lyase family protein, partial [Alphaproteobacteria bacterium]
MSVFGQNGSKLLHGTLFAFVAAVTLTPSIALGSAVCVQEELAKLGYQPGPADGALGRRSVGAANLFAEDMGMTLPDLTDDTAEQWCSEIQAFAASPAATILKAPVAQLLPKDMLLDFARADPAMRAKMCAQSGSISALSRVEPVKKIEGFTSRMKGDVERVPGALASEKFGENFGALAAHAFAANDDQLKGDLLDILQNWAKQRAFLDTTNCSVNRRICTQWTVPDGSDLSPYKDWFFATTAATGLIRAYHIALADFEQVERKSQHQDIGEWIAATGERLARPDISAVYHASEKYWPAIVNDYASGNPSAARAKLVRVEAALDRVILMADGSIKNATTRGDRALWYQFFGLGIVVTSMEMIRAADVPISNRVEERLHKAVALFIAAIEDPDVLDPWARQRFSSKYDGTQDFNFSRWPNAGAAGSWLHIYPYRYPNREEATQLRRLVPISANSAVQDAHFGIGLGCLYNSASVAAGLLMDPDVSPAALPISVKFATISEGGREPNS